MQNKESNPLSRKSINELNTSSNNKKDFETGRVSEAVWRT